MIKYINFFYRYSNNYMNKAKMIFKKFILTEK